MKTLMIILLLLPALCAGQTVYLNFAPPDFGIGARVDLRDFYAAATYGNWNDYAKAGIADHWRLTAGINKLLPVRIRGYEKYSITAGVNYHFYRFTPAVDTRLKPAYKRHVSFELGWTFKYRWFAVSVREDILRFNPIIDVGWNINLQKQRYRRGVVLCI